MGANAANRLGTMLDNLFQILAVEWLTANRGLSFREGQPGAPLQGILSKYHAHVTLPSGDDYWAPILFKTKAFMEETSSLA